MVQPPSKLEQGMAVGIGGNVGPAQLRLSCGVGLIVRQEAGTDRYEVRLSDGSLHSLCPAQLHPLVPSVSLETPVFPSSGTCVVCLEPECASFAGVPCVHQCVCKRCSQDL